MLLTKSSIVGTLICLGSSLPVLQYNFKKPSADDDDALNIPFPLRKLKLGSLNFLHTTDTHGWYGSHLNQDDYDADWGDLVSFTEQFKSRLLDTNQDLVLIDTGDKSDGNGLSDATDEQGLNSTEIFNKIDYDLLTLGNHELYNPMKAELEYYKTAMSEKFRTKYVSSNVEFVTQEGHSTPFGNKYVYFETPNTKTKILAFSFLFDFSIVNPKVIVTPAVEELTNKKWFKNVLEEFPQDKVDLIVIFGHLPVTDKANHEINKIHNLMRFYYPQTVIQYFGGHSHIRDFVQLDNKSTAIQSGKFCETLGFLSIDNLKKDKPTFFRRYIDFNKKSFVHHLGLKNYSELTTEKGFKVSQKIHHLRKILDLDETYGYVPKNYFTYTRPLSSSENLYNFLQTTILPRLHSPVTDDSIGRYVMINTGSIRYDLSKGPFTRDTEYIVSPFNNEWEYVVIPMKIAAQIKDFLNNGKVIMSLASPEIIQTRKQQKIASNDSKSLTYTCPFIYFPLLNEGFTTQDDYGCHGDDTWHNTQTVYDIPNVVQHEHLVSQDENEMVHFIYYSFMRSHIINAATTLMKDAGIDHSKIESKIYGGVPVKRLMRSYFQEMEELSHS